MEALAEALREYTGTMLLITHDRHLIHTVAARVLEIHDQQLLNHLSVERYWEARAARGGQPVAGSMELRRDTPQRQIELRRQHEHSERGRQRHAPVHQPDADHSRDQRDRHRRGQLERERGEKGDPERPHRLAPELLARSGDRFRLRLAAPVGAKGRQAAHDVEEVRAHLREGRQPPPRPFLGSPADQSAEDRDQG